MKKRFCVFLSVLVMLSCFTLPFNCCKGNFATKAFALDGEYQNTVFLNKHTINVSYGSTLKLGYEGDTYHDDCDDCLSNGDGHRFDIEINNRYTYDNYDCMGTTISVSEDDDSAVLLITGKKVGKTTLTVYAQDDEYITNFDEDDEEYGGVFDDIVINVLPASATTLTVSSIKDQKYTGKNITPVPVVKFGKKTLSKDKDFTVSYKNNKNVGTATAVITLKGLYTGTLKKNFKIIPVISKTSASIYAGEKISLSVKSSTKTVWKSSKTSVAKVDSSGNVTAVNKGNATITATTGGYKLSCKITVKGITLNKTSKALYLGTTYSLKISGKGTTKWKSSNAKIATVSSKGVVTAKGVGTATITATVGSSKATCKITVKNQSLSETKLTIYTGRTKTLKLNGAFKAVAWSSSNTKVATVSKNGVVKGKSVGTAKIHAKHNGRTYTCTVTIKKGAPIAINGFNWGINSAGGVEPEMTITNYSSKTIKYVDFTVYFFNRFGDVVYNDIAYDQYYRNLSIVGPLKPGEKETFYWKPVFYNDMVSAIRVTDVVVTFTDNTTQKVNYNMLWYDSDYYYQ